MAFLGLAHTVPYCACTALLLQDGRGALGGGVDEFAAFLCVSVVAYSIILIGASVPSGCRAVTPGPLSGVAVALLSTAALDPSSTSPPY